MFMDLLTRSDLEELATPEPAGLHVSLFMPTHRYGGAVEADQLAWKNLVDAAEVTLLKQVRRSEAEKLLNPARDRKSTRLNSSHVAISYAGFCLKKKKSQSAAVGT